MKRDAYPLEQCEIAAQRDFYASASEAVQKQLGIYVAEYAHVLATFAGRSHVLALNRAIGLGTFEQATTETVAAILDSFELAGAPRMFVQVHPGARPQHVVRRLTDFGFRYYNNWFKLYHRLTTIQKPTTALRVERIGKPHAMAFGRIAATAFEWPPEAVTWIADTVGRERWHHFMAFDGEMPVATAALVVFEDEGWLDFATTMPTHRNLGAQSALIAARLELAKALGCRRVQVETAEPQPDKVAVSLRNVRRLGFHVAYRRANFLLERSG